MLWAAGYVNNKNSGGDMGIPGLEWFGDSKMSSESQGLLIFLLGFPQIFGFLLLAQIVISVPLDITSSVKKGRRIGSVVSSFLIKNGKAFPLSRYALNYN